MIIPDSCGVLLPCFRPSRRSRAPLCPALVCEGCCSKALWTTEMWSSTVPKDSPPESSVGRVGSFQGLSHASPWPVMRYWLSLTQHQECCSHLHKVFSVCVCFSRFPSKDSGHIGQRPPYYLPGPYFQTSLPWQVPNTSDNWGNMKLKYKFTLAQKNVKFIYFFHHRHFMPFLRTPCMHRWQNDSSPWWT